MVDEGAESSAFYKPLEVARIFNMCRDDIYDLLRDGTLPAAKIGKYWRIPKDVVDGMIRVDDEVITPTSLDEARTFVEIKQFFATMSRRRSKDQFVWVAMLRFGPNPLTLDRTGQRIGRSRERVREIQAVLERVCFWAIVHQQISVQDIPRSLPGILRPLLTRTSERLVVLEKRGAAT